MVLNIVGMAEISLQTKYERLAQEYSKLRSNTSVLKKAVIEEKTNNAKLTEKFKACEVAQRKQEQELEALRFRNQQLVKRVEVLQGDLDAIQTAGSKKRGQNAPKAKGGAAASAVGSSDLIGRPDNEVVMEQLQKTIEENARLNIELSDSRTAHESELRELRDSLNKYEEESIRQRDKIMEVQAHVQAECSMLKDEKLTLENQLISKEAALQNITQEVNDLRQKLTAMQLRFDQLKASIVTSTQSPASGDDPPATKPSNQVLTSTPSGSKSVETSSPVPSQALLPCVQECLGYSSRLIRGLKEWHENHFHGLTQAFGPLRSSPELLEAVKKCSQAAGSLEHEVQLAEAAVKESNPKLSVGGVIKLRSVFSEYVDRFAFSLPLLCKRIEDECALSFCQPTLINRNSEIIHSLRQFTTIMSRFKRLFIPEEADDNSDNSTLPQLTVELHQSGKELARLFNCKVSLEQKTQEISEEVKTSNEALVHGLLVARSALDKLSVVMAENSAFFTPSGLHILREVLIEGGHELIDLPSKAVISNGVITDNAVLSPSVDLPDDQPGESALGAENSKRLEREVSQLRAALKELEQSRDSLGLEAQLEKMRREKESQRRAELERELLSLRSMSPSSGLEEAPGGGSSIAETSDLGGSTDSTATAACDPISADGSEREAVIVRYYQDIVGRQQQQLYQLTGVAENVMAECENLRAQWSLSQKRNQELESEVDYLKAHHKEIIEDLDSTRRNYEIQLSTLTEHIADMNDKLVERQETILDLKRQLENKEPPARKLSFNASSLFSSVTKRK